MVSVLFDRGGRGVAAACSERRPWVGFVLLGSMATATVTPWQILIQLTHDCSIALLLLIFCETDLRGPCNHDVFLDVLLKNHIINWRAVMYM